MGNSFKVEVEIAVWERHWLPIPEEKKRRFAEEMSERVHHDPAYPAPSVAWENDSIAVVTMVISGDACEDASKSARDVVRSHAYNRPVELAPEWAIATSVRSCEPAEA